MSSVSFSNRSGSSSIHRWENCLPWNIACRPLRWTLSRNQQDSRQFSYRLHSSKLSCPPSKNWRNHGRKHFVVLMSGSLELRRSRSAYSSQGVSNAPFGSGSKPSAPQVTLLRDVTPRNLQWITPDLASGERNHTVLGQR
jgi:hypothetical protein